MSRRAAKVDANQSDIMKALRSVDGVSVYSLAGQGDGCPDLLVGSRHQTFLCEVKDGVKRLTPDQVRFIEKWQGSSVVILRDVETALAWARRIATVD
tara:strand:+ start:787 stop:1077 length:291 start_codon:yes stop_codon:yes gene_type:complete